MGITYVTSPATQVAPVSALIGVLRFAVSPFFATPVFRRNIYVVLRGLVLVVRVEHLSFLLKMVSLKRIQALERKSRAI